MSGTAEISIIDHLLAVATVRLFQAIGVEVEEGDPDLHPRPRVPAVASTMGFSNDGLRGAVTIVVERTTLAALHPGADLSAADAQRDACGELANMLVGELKRQLRSLGVTVQLGLPVAFAGDDLQLCPSWAADSRCQAFASPHGVIRVRLDALLTELRLAPELDHAPIAAAGDALLF